MLSMLFFATVLWISGCAQQPTAPLSPMAPLPEPVSLEGEHQRQLHSARQWQLVAEDMVSQLVANLQEKKLDTVPVYINLQTKRTAFTTAFNDFLITALVNKGVKVASVKAGSHIYNYKIQIVEYKSLRSTLANEQYKFTSLAAGLVVMRNVGDLIGIDGSLLAAGAVADAVNVNMAPNMELVITTSILDRHIFLTRSTDIYYINSSDKHLFLPPSSSRASDTFNDPFYQLK